MSHSPLKAREILEPSGSTIYYHGPGIEQGPLPALIYFALSGRDSLQLDPFNQPVMALIKQPLRIFSFNLPHHEEGTEYSKAMERWATDILNQNNFVQAFIDQAMSHLSFLINEGWIDEQHIGAAGLSRGGFMATHLAAQDQRVNTILGFAPLIRLSGLQTGNSLKESALAKSLNLENLIPSLIKKTIRYYIGNRDHLVSTDHCYHFIRDLTEETFKAGQRSPQVEMTISPSIGHKGHGTPPHIFEAGANWIKSQLLKEKEQLHEAT